ncbi:PAS domain-containing protein [Bacillus timonensis]|nr:PAS domain-containing protein [Bacillus timonensis]
MNRFRSRLLFGLITLIVAVLLGLGILLGQLFKSFYFNSFNQRIEKEANLVLTHVNELGLYNSKVTKEIYPISQAMQTRITIVDEVGHILYDSNLDEVNDLVHESFISEITKKHMNNKESFHILNEEFGVYFFGLPIEEKSKVVGFIILSSPVESLEQINQKIWALLLSSLGLAFVVILLLGVKIMNQYTKPIDSATKVAIELAKGNYNARTYENQLNETGMLSQSINILARNLQEMTKTQQIQQDRLHTLIENMGSGLILIDGRGYIILVNRAYKETFNVNPADYLYRTYKEAFDHKEISVIVEEIFLTEVKVRRQILVPFNIERKHFEIYGAPIIGTNNKWNGVVLVFHDITELKKLEQMRKDFVANVSHELRTPITSIKGFTETLLDGAMKDEQTLEYFLSIVLKESERLQTLIQDLLDLSKIEQQGFLLTIQNVRIDELLEEVIFILKAKAQDKEIDLSLEVDTEPNNVLEGDPHRLKQVFINLVSNGIAYTPRGGKVSVKVQESSKDIEVCISDSGIGIDEKEIPRIFERFYRVDRDRSRNSGGTGLGLAIVKHLIEAHHGHISVKSKRGEGSTFIVTLSKKFVDM